LKAEPFASTIQKVESVGSSRKGSGGFLVKARVVASSTRRFNFYADSIQHSTCNYSSKVLDIVYIFFFNAMEWIR
jgi:hypothetical protein